MMGSTSSQDTWRVGVLFSQTGVTSVIEKSQRNGVLLAVDELNNAGGIHGRKIQPVEYDPGSNVVRYGELAEHLLTEDNVNVIFGCYTSSSRKEVLPVIERRNALLFYPTLYEGFEYSVNVIYGGAAPNQNSVPLASYLMQNYGDRFYFVGSDYIYPRESNRVMRHIIRQGGGEVTGERYVSLEAGPDDFDEVILEIEALRPDVIFSTVVGTGTINFYRAYLRTAGASRAPIASLTTNEAEVSIMGREAAAGHITAAPYFRNIETAANQRFLELYQHRFGTTSDVTSCCEAAYFQVHMFAEALKRTGSTDTDRLLSALRNTEFDAPQGRVKIDSDNNHTYLHTRIGRVNSDGEYVIELEGARSIKPDPYLVIPALNDWSVRLVPPKNGLINS